MNAVSEDRQDVGRDDVVSLKWLGGVNPRARTGVTWGVPWAQGVLREGEGLGLSAEGERGQEYLPMQCWPLAFWPDGSVKWTGHAATVDGEHGTELSVVRRPSGGDAGQQLTVTEEPERIVIDTGAMTCRVSREGSVLINEITVGRRSACCGVRLVGELEHRESGSDGAVARRVKMQGTVGSVTVEQRGPERAVIRFDGHHIVQEAAGARRWLPFIVRLYCFRGVARIRLVHTIVFDGEPERDFLAAVGVEASVPLTGAAYERHVRFGGDTGLFAEAAQLLLTWRLRDAGGLYQEQIAGRNVDLGGGNHAGLRELLRDQAVWRSFKLIQESAEHYSISKQTEAGCGWVNAVHGRRAKGVVAVAGVGGGLGMALADFWRKAPRSLEVVGAVDDVATIRGWFWSPDVAAMDLRHYDTRPHMQAAYEGFDEIRSDPRGIANTNELLLEPIESGAAHETLDALGALADAPPLLVCEPKRYHDTEVLGVWSLVDRSGPGRAWLEDQLNAALGFYLDEVEQRKWYGFWDYGDVMHTYDPVRHGWRYDMGGFAWQNTELVPNIWLWYSFLRTGRADIFRMASAMARHTSEVDVYHQGSYAGLGSRHNVLHWGCSCKEARISMAGLHRAFYYLTADERMGDIFTEVVSTVEGGIKGLDPARTLVPVGSAVTHTRSGPDWAALSSNWMTQWERSRDEPSAAALRVGLASLRKAPLRLLSGPVFGYDPTTKILEYLGDDNYSYHMVIAFGAPETWMELASLMPEAGLDSMLEEFGAFAAMSSEEKIRYTDGAVSGKNWNQSMFYARLIAFAARQRQDEVLAQRAWDLLVGEAEKGVRLPIERAPVPAGKSFRQLDEIPWVSTNSVSQWSLNVIECLELVPGAVERACAARVRDDRHSESVRGPNAVSR